MFLIRNDEELKAYETGLEWTKTSLKMERAMPEALYKPHRIRFHIATQMAQEKAIETYQRQQHPMWRDHNCSVCQNGTKACRARLINHCGNPIARNH